MPEPPNWIDKATLGVVIVSLIAAGFAAWQAWRLADLTQNAVRDAKRATIEANRAWIAPRSVYLNRPLEMGKPVSYRLTYDNTGKSPALDINQSDRITFVSSSVFADMNQETVEAAMNTIPECNVPTPASGKRAAFPFGEEEYKVIPLVVDPLVNEDVLSGKLAVVIEGCFTYRTFDEVHHTSYCFVFGQRDGKPFPVDAQATICPVRNRAD